MGNLALVLNSIEKMKQISKNANSKEEAKRLIVLFLREQKSKLDPDDMY